MLKRCPVCRNSELVLRYKAEATYSLNILGQLRGKKSQFLGADPAPPVFEDCRDAYCPSCGKAFPLEETRSGIIRVKMPKVFVGLVVWNGTSRETEQEVHNLFINHARRKCECCGEENGFLTLRDKSESSLLPLARAQAVREALKTDCTHLLFIDQDTVEMDGEGVLRLAFQDLPIISAYITRRAPPFDPVHRYIDENGRPKLPEISEKELWSLEVGQVRECWGVGMAFTLIKREALEAVGEPYFQFLPVETYPLPAESGWMRGEDMSFSAAARSKGFLSYVDCGIQLGHLRSTASGVHDWLAQSGKAPPDLPSILELRKKYGDVGSLETVTKP